MKLVRKPEDSYPPSERSKYGVIATIANTVTGEVRVLNYAHGTSVQAAQAVVETCDQLGPDWLVRCMSHPLSVLADLRGRDPEKSRPLERVLLGRLHRTDLIEAERRSKRALRRRAA